jgi:putative lipoic acid-binding regulatory protein
LSREQNYLKRYYGILPQLLLAVFAFLWRRCQKRAYIIEIFNFQKAIHDAERNSVSRLKSDGAFNGISTKPAVQSIEQLRRLYTKIKKYLTKLDKVNVSTEASLTILRVGRRLCAVLDRLSRKIANYPVGVGIFKINVNVHLVFVLQ